MNNVIVALATPPLKGALAIIRSSGKGVFAIADELFSKKISGTKKRSVFYGRLSDDGQVIDDAIVLAFPGPDTVTGEDVIEIDCHGSMLIANQIISAFIKRGARYATRGEFSSRAFYNGKMDLIEAEAVNDLINATTSEAKNLSLLSLEGKTSSLIRPLKQKIADLLSLIEVNIDYPEFTDIEQANEKTILAAIADLRASVAALIKGGREGKIIQEGIKVAIVGEPNVGKSSLLNALLDEDKAIVSDIPGTTRDIVEGEINVHGVSLHLLDTAGIRESGDSIEKIGVDRAEKSIAAADLIIVVLDGSKPLTDGDNKILKTVGEKSHLIVYNKADLLKERESGKLYISALKKDIGPLKDKIFETLGLSEEAFVTPSLSNARQFGLLEKIDQALSQAARDAKQQAPIDLVSVSLQTAYNASRELLGEDATLDLSDEIFSRFCVGK